ncbi:MAG TPA: UDP-glucose/GDP-mannose dehydrogenase family protein [Trebonia sp.]|nr:UDP-glucose/GDP-mannose dehydrogenase family protein [Trebonia sp.]
MQISVIGCGHLGATHAACMASIGHEVVGVDIDSGRVELLNSGRAWFYEPGLDVLLAENIKAGRLRFTTSFAEAAAFARVHFIGVATPGQPDGAYDLTQLHSAVAALVPHVRGEALIIGKSTVPPGTAIELQAMADSLRHPGPEASVEVAWNPEFLRESCAVQDTLRPDRIVVGTASGHAAELIWEIYQPIADAGVPLLVTDLETAELVKGAANAFLATKLSFINSMADICAATGGDVRALAAALGMDPRIGPAFLQAGIGYGGACLPKDVRGLGMFARQIGVAGAADLLAAVDAVNAARPGQAIGVARHVLGPLAGRRIGIWGAAFKAGTDDVRDSAALRIADGLRQVGAEVTVYDPLATENAQAALPEIKYTDCPLAAATGAEALVVATAWPEFAAAPPAEVAARTSRQVVIDACQGINAELWRCAGWEVASLVAARPIGTHF